MNWVSPVFLGVAVACAALNAQSPAGVSPNPPGQTAASAESSHDLNMRAYTELLRTDLRNSRTQIMAQVMQLDSDQATVFWPIYKQFESDFKKIGDRGVSLVKTYTDNYDQMTNEMADRLATEVLAIEQQRHDLKREYYQKFKKALDPITAARFLQVENQLENLLSLQIASQLPVVQSSQGGTQ